jgi:WD40 repeat protein
VRFWHLEGQQVVTFAEHRGPVRAIAFTPDGQRLATSSNDGTIRRWEVQGNPLEVLQGNGEPVRAIALSPDGQYLASAQGQTLRLWQGSQPFGREFRAHQALVRSVQFSPDGQQFASAGDDGLIRVWTGQGQALASWEADEQRVWQVAWSPDGQQLASAGQDGVVRLWTPDGQPVNSLTGHLGPVYAGAFSPDGEWLASAGQDGTIRLWYRQDENRKAIYQVYDAEVNAIAFSADGKSLVSGDSMGNIQLVNLDIQQQVADWSAHPNSIIRSVQFSPNGRLFATTADDGTAKLWVLDDLEQLRTRGCALVSGYLTYLKLQTEGSRETSEEDTFICDDVL